MRHAFGIERGEEEAQGRGGDIRASEEFRVHGIARGVKISLPSRLLFAMRICGEFENHVADPVDVDRE